MRTARPLLVVLGFLALGCSRKPTADETAALRGAADTSVAAAPVSTGSSGAAAPSADQLASLAHRVVTNSLGIHAGDVVIIDGGTHTIGLMEAAAIEAQKAGGMPSMWLESDRVARSFVTDVPDQFMSQQPKYLADWFGHTTVYIGLGGIEDPKAVYGDVPEPKLAKMAASGQVVYDMLNASPIRGAFINYPTKGAAADNGMPFERYAAMQWDAIGADYSQIAAMGDALLQRLRVAKKIRVTSANGTDLTFALAGRPVILDAGILAKDAGHQKAIFGRFVTLPGGSLTLAPDERSVTGVIVAPRDRCKYKPLRDAHYEFTAGMLTKASAKEGDDCLQETLKTYGTGLHRLGTFTLGLNPALQVIEDDGDYRPGAAAGLVSVSLGDNQLFGGSNRVPGAVSVALPITRATVEVDGQKIVEDGKLVGASVASTAR
jgi:aminopeptidase